jgi:hypothetical protein
MEKKEEKGVKVLRCSGCGVVIHKHAAHVETHLGSEGNWLKPVTLFFCSDMCHLRKMYKLHRQFFNSPQEVIQHLVKFHGISETTAQAFIATIKHGVAYTGGKVGRNDPCPCGSGRKYKKCCGSR